MRLPCLKRLSTGSIQLARDFITIIYLTLSKTGMPNVARAQTDQPCDMPPLTASLQILLRVPNPGQRENTSEDLHHEVPGETTSGTRPVSHGPVRQKYDEFSEFIGLCLELRRVRSSICVALLTVYLLFRSTNIWPGRYTSLPALDLGSQNLRTRGFSWVLGKPALTVDPSREKSVL